MTGCLERQGISYLSKVPDKVEHTEVSTVILGFEDMAPGYQSVERGQD